MISDLCISRLPLLTLQSSSAFFCAFPHNPMPLYEFRCPKGHDFERFYRSIGTAPTEVLCPECGALAERRLSAAGLVFKGSGFYITDYKRAGEKQGGEETKPAAGSKAGAESKSGAEPKPAAEAKPAERTKKKKDSGDK